jgi:mono/diheme cytochrome c family protein
MLDSNGSFHERPSKGQGVPMLRSTVLAIVAIGSCAAIGCTHSISSGFGETGPVPEPGALAGFDAGPPVIQPDFGSIGTATKPPPAISGGTLLVLADGKTAVAADPDRDAVYVADTTAEKLLFTVALQAGDEPGRSAEDAAHRVHVALRGAGALVTIDPTTGTIVGRRPVCPAPRGVAYDTTNDAVWVACATGELVSLPAAGGAATKNLHVERDLRDVVVQNGNVVVSKFRTAEILYLGADGSVVSRGGMPALIPSDIPHVAWRMVADGNGSYLVVHQEESTQPIETSQPGAYGSGGIGAGTGPVESVVTFVGSSTSMNVSGTTLPVNSVDLPGMVLPVDVAISRDGKRQAVVGAGNTFIDGTDNLAVMTSGELSDIQQVGGVDAQATAVAFDAAGNVVVQTREPAALWVVRTDLAPTRITLSSTSRADLAHAVFHTLAGAAIACASCHPEGGDDGHVWLLDGTSKRTPSLRGTIRGTAPYHWFGNEADLATLANDVYTGRMSGAQLDAKQLSSLQSWVEAIPAPPAPSWLDAAAVTRGQAIFARADVGCSSCHSGAKFTNNATVNVGTGDSFQVPPLVGVGWRTPLLHDGCADTIGDRFYKCATPQHGSIGKLTSQDVSDLVAYLESL